MGDAVSRVDSDIMGIYPITTHGHKKHAQKIRRSDVWFLRYAGGHWTGTQTHADPNTLPVSEACKVTKCRSSLSTLLSVDFSFVSWWFFRTSQNWHAAESRPSTFVGSFAVFPLLLLYTLRVQKNWVTFIFTVTWANVGKFFIIVISYFLLIPIVKEF